ncbi:hemerythrin domain-containing protein [Mycolicibacterium sp. YH-1]|uniref:hemerythrin domain-containing protein n=1 Tax=Mycolicibacterium sp. YH-1 TaxID=2908837 RepID=UPI001F4C33C9|nr:hemerythrin domain-containing protein [Mycolicibacterium sp. YH-1]UNB51663.1 hemerythrin domain-containing protein [Mycolicibacterium sp. YH-1]
MASQPITTPGDVVTYLKAQHEAIKALFIHTLDAKNAADQQASFTRLRTLLAVHETAEEMMIHPRVRRKVDGGEEVAAARLSEEHDAKIALGNLERIPCGTAEFSKELIHLQRAVIEHAEREEAEEFTLLGEQLDADELAKLRTAVQFAERIAPTHPHAGVESGFANFAVGPFASLVDRARDALRGRAV